MKCLKCQNDTFDKNIILTKTLDTESKYHQNEDKFDVLACKGCHLTQWYDYYIVSGEKNPDRKYDKSIYEIPRLLEFKCLNCQSGLSKIERIKPLERIISAWEGEVLIRICTKCGLAEMYQILLAYPGKGSSPSRLSEKILAAREFICPICKSDKVSQTGEVLFNKDSVETPYLFGTCEKCKYIMFFAGYLE